MAANAKSNESDKCTQNSRQAVKKVLLINPPAKVFLFPDGTPSQRKHCPPPLGLAYLAAALLKNYYKEELEELRRIVWRENFEKKQNRANDCLVKDRYHKYSNSLEYQKSEFTNVDS